MIYLIIPLITDTSKENMRTDITPDKTRVYICHTYYHAYMAAVRELAGWNGGSAEAASSALHTASAETGAEVHREVSSEKSNADTHADIILSTMSNDFENLKSRLEASGVFRSVYMFDEKEDVTSDRVMSHHTDRGNLILNMIHRIIYTRELGRLQEPYVPVDLSTYGDVYVFCDSDPIGYYLNYKKIPYHAIEDGLNSGRLDDQAHLSNPSAFGFKSMLAKTGLIFIECGYSRYCIDYEVNDISANHSVPPNVVELPHSRLIDRLSQHDHEILARIFIADFDELESFIDHTGQDKPMAMILTEPLCALDVRRRMFSDIIDMYKSTHQVIIKPHPRDLLDYSGEFPDVYVIKGRFPMEVLNDVPGLRIEKLISVITQVDDIDFADEIVYLGLDFMDKYEAPDVHRRLDTLQ